MKTSGEYLPAVDAYINAAAPFARPILEHIRALMHEGAPGVEEAIKWRMPFFVLNGVILGNMAAFKAHCALGFWGRESANAMKEEGLVSHAGAMGRLARVESMDDLPPRAKLLAHIRKSAKLIESGVRTQSIERPARSAPKPEPPVPAELAAALKKSKKAAATFAAFPPSCRKEYITWVAEAKREETKVSRVAQAIAWMEEGKRRNWKMEQAR